MDVIDMHNHFIAPEVIDYLAREGSHYATRIVERESRRFFLIQEKAMRPIDGPISNADARLADMDREGIAKQAISCVPFLMYPDVDATLGLAIAQVNNDAMAALAAADSAHFVPLASVPMQDLDCGGEGTGTGGKVGAGWASRSHPRSSSATSTSPISKYFGKRPRRCGWWFAFIPLKLVLSGALARYFLQNLVGNSPRTPALPRPY